MPDPAAPQVDPKNILDNVTGFDARARTITVSVLTVGLVAVWGALAVLGNADQFPDTLQILTGALVGLLIGKANPLGK